MPACSNPVVYPLSAAQTEIWLAQQLNPDSPAYNIGQFTEIQGAVDPVLFEAALRQVVEEAESLRLQFIESGNGFQQFVGSPDWSLPLIDVSADADPQAAAEAWMRADYNQPIDLLHGPLFGYALLQIAPQRFFWYQRYHHIVIDGTGRALIVQRMAQVYSALANGLVANKCPFGPVSVLLKSDIHYRASAQFTKDQAYWLKHCVDWPEPVTLANRQAPALYYHLRQTTYLSSQAMRTHAAGAKRFLAQLMTAAMAAYLHRWIGVQDVVLGLPVTARFGEDRCIPGMVSNIVPLRFTVRSDMSLSSLLEQAAQEIQGGLRHQRYRSEDLRRGLGLASSQLLFGPMINLMLFDCDLSFGEHSSTNHNLVNGPVEDLMISAYVLPEDSSLRIDFEANPALYTADELSAHQRRFLKFLNAFATEPTQLIGDIDLLDAAERRQLLVDWNATAAPYPEHQCIHQVFEEQVERTPEAAALVCENQVLTYAELNARANCLAYQLIELGVKPDMLVPICVERSPAMVVGLLAILKAGGAYVPLDPAYPPERLAHMLADAAPTILIADTAGRAALDEAALASLTILNPHALTELAVTNPQIPELTPHHLAYVIYTSGSTGMPKGVMVEHRNVVNLTRAEIACFGVCSSSRVLQFASFSFDVSVWEIVMALGCGAGLYLPPDTLRLDRNKLWDYLAKHTITHATLPPALLQNGEDLPRLDTSLTLILAAEAPSTTLLRNLIHQCAVFNAYGPTETTAGTTVWRCSHDFSSEVVPIGRPIANTRLYLLDANGQPVPSGAVGELYIGGAGVTRGYLNRPELTAECFLPDPFSDLEDARLYKTGDLARYLPDGNLVFLGRNDHQIKIRGFRIEPGEIEARMVELPQVHDAIVLALGKNSDKRLVAYVVAEFDEQLAYTLRVHLAAKLPEYMVPAAFVRLDSFPLTPNGKLDRRALPAPDDEAFARQVYEAPQGEIETTLALIWAELLGLERISRHDSFFALGGHSLIAVQMIERLRHLGLTVSVRALFDTPTLSVLAQSLGQHREVAAPSNLITPDTSTLTPDLLPLIDLTQTEIDWIVAHTPGGVGNIQDVYALSPLQDGILFHHLLATEGDPYLLIAQMAFDNRTLLDRYLNAVHQVVKRHDILRTAFVWKNLSTPVQVVWRQAPLSITTLTLDPSDGPVIEQLVQRFDPRQYRIDLTQAPLLRFIIAQDSDGRWLLVQLLHHLIGDHSTLELMNAEVQAFLENRGDALPAPQPFRNLIAQVRLGLGEEMHEHFFTEMLADIEEPTLPFGLAEIHRDGSQVTEARQVLPQDLNDRLRAQAKRLGVSLASLCHLAWAQVLARASGQQRVVFGTVLFGRMKAGEGADCVMGLFINTLPLRVDLDDTGVEDSVRYTHARLAALLEHEHASLALAQRCSSVPAGAPLFSALLNYRHNAMLSGESRTMPGIELLHIEERDNYPLGLSIDDSGQALKLTVQIAQPFHPDRVCGYMQQALASLAQALEHTPQTPVRQLEVLPVTERELLLQMGSETATPYPAHQCLHQLFEAQVKRTPDNTALVHEDQVISYTELNARANCLAHHLILLGVCPDSRVALYAQPSIEMVVGMLATLKAGGAYVPLDPNYPPERLVDMVTDSAPVVLLSIGPPHAAVVQCLGVDVPVLDLQADAGQWKRRSSRNPNPHKLALSAEHLAYVIYTSGSTGRPKGVMVQHRSVVNLVTAMAQRLELSSQDRVLQFSSLSFDASVGEVFVTLISGAALLLRTDAWLAGAQQFWSLCEANRISVMDLPTQFWTQLAQESVPIASSARVIMISGDALSASARAAWFAVAGHRPRLLNVYGPTETTISATVHEVTAGDCRWRTIGRPIANTRIYILDTSMQLTPVGMAGELYIGGAGVARGYLNRPELTAERFLPDLFSDCEDAWMYKTGDLVRYLPDGNLEFLGRNDHQVKIRGFRIEPGEIETHLVEHPQVREAIVLALGEHSNKRLVAYVVAEPDEQLANTLRAHLATGLPEYMVPAAFVQLDALPLTPNGKLDRRALPTPDDEAFARPTYEAPQGEIETVLATIWAELLAVERVSRHDSFFALGGHSLLAVQMIERLRRLGLTVSVRALFDTSTLSMLAKSLGQHQKVVVPPNAITFNTLNLVPDLLPLIDLTQADIDCIVKQTPGGVANIQDIYALSPLQDGILFHHLLATKGDPYLLTSQMAFADRERLDCYLDAVQQVVNRHDILRTAFVWESLSMPAQVVWRRAPVSITELTLDPADGPVIEQLIQRFDPRQHRLDLTQAPLLRFVVAQDSDGRWLLIELMHHLIGDHSTAEEVRVEIQAFLDGRGDALQSPQPFRNLVAQARLGLSQQAHERFFTDMLADVDESTLPFGLAEIYRDGSQVTESHRMLPQDLNNRLRAQAKRLGVSLASLCHLAWAQVLARASGQQRVVFGTVLFGRMQAGEGADRAMGLFINTLPLRIDLDNRSVQDSVRDTHARLAALLEHEHASLALAQRCSSVPAGTPLFSALLNYRHNAISSSVSPTLTGIEFLGAQERTNYPFMLSVEDFGTALGLTAQVVQQFDSARVCGYMQQTLQSLAEALEHEPDMPVWRLEVLPIEEREHLLQSCNTTVASYPEYPCIHQLFEEQVERTPEATALVYEDQVLSYAELNARANCLAHQLIELGVQPDARVAICVERSPAIVVGVLAILKAGGAYVPLDPAYSSERLTHILADATPSILIADVAGRTALGKTALASLTVLDPNRLPESPITNPQVPELTSHHLAYVIYTSGSTGTPKGVMVEHAQIVRLFDATESWYHFNSHDTWCLFHSFAFDFSVWELWGALRYGGKLVLVPHHIARSPQEFYRLVCEQGITVLNQTPSAFKTFIVSQAQSELQDSLRYVIFGGEALEPTILQTWYATRSEHSPQLVNMYGITETTVHVTYRPLQPQDSHQTGSPIGVRIPDLKVYLLDAYGQPVPLGAIGELYIGGAGVARGYLNRPELTAERFLRDPFSKHEEARMYKTGDVARYLSNGVLEYLGRNDDQVKIRGFRIEPGEIEARLVEHPQVRAAALLALGEGSDKRLIAYVVAEPDEQLASTLRSHLATRLPEYMMPAAFVRLDALPLTPNGKLDRRALPAPDGEAFARQAYEAPQGKVETALADIWAELLNIEQISRHDSFFALGGHSLLAVQMIERLRRLGLTVSVRALFDTPTLSVLAQALGQHREVAAPLNLITLDTAALTPNLLPLINLTQTEIDCIVEQTPGGVANIQDIYALSPLQDGMLFHHLLATEGDPYLQIAQMAFANRALLDRYLEAVQQVVNRHDILRTAFVWEHLSTPAQVVWRQASLSITELFLDPVNGPITEQLAQRFNPRQYRIDLTQAPLLRFVIAQDNNGRWLLIQLLHHLIDDNSSLKRMNAEIQAFLDGHGGTLQAPQPFRNLVAQARLGLSQQAHERFFTDILADVEEPTLPFGLAEIHRDGSQVTDSHRMLSQDLNDRLRAQARRLGVSLASLCHLAWAQVLARTSGQQRVVFGTVLFGRMQAGEGADRAMGPFINTLPLRIDLDDRGVEDSVRDTHARLAALLEHEHASLALAQRCSSVPAGTPLFSALLNYRHNAMPSGESQMMPGIELLRAEERDNYPFGLSVEDFGEALGLTAQIVQPFDPDRVCSYMQQALESLVKALEHAPQTPARQLEVLPDTERELLLQTWNATAAPYPARLCLHQLFEVQVECMPDATALVYENQVLSYAELNTCANRLAHQLIELGVAPDVRVAICVERSPALVVGLLAILKAGGAYVPLDPAYPSERLTYILTDAAPAILLADAAGRASLGEVALAPLTVLDPNRVPEAPITNPQIPDLTPHHLAYVIYTSGSTGMPKGVMVEHRGIVNLAQAQTVHFGILPSSRVLQFASLSFDISVGEIFMTLGCGAGLYLPSDSVRRDRNALWDYLVRYTITHANLTPALLGNGEDLPSLSISLTLILGGEAPSAPLLRTLSHQGVIFNAYGPTETTVSATIWRYSHDLNSKVVPIGRPIANTRVYLLDAYGQPVPLGAVGELYIGGVGVTRGYLNRPELTAERFRPDPFSDCEEARMYKTGDLARYLPDGNLEFLGRNDHQVKIRGFRIEPGEIEARLVEHPQVREATVLALGEHSDKRLVAYVIAEPDEQLASTLRTHLATGLPEYMVPAAFVRLDMLPLTPSGKLDRRALPTPDNEAFARQAYEAPRGEIETALAAIWTELLGLEHVSRHDSFFELGGHSLLAVQMIGRLRHLGLTVSVRTLFDTPTLSVLAQSLGQHHEVPTPPNLITPNTVKLTPDLLPLINFAQAEIDCIVEQTPGGVANIQDIYALSPLQDGILFHHLLATKGDPYLLTSQMAFADRERLDCYLDAVQQVVKRHDILRTAFVWEGLSTPAQVVWRHAPLSITELSLDPVNGLITEQLAQRFDPRYHRIDLTQAPLLRFVVAQDSDGRWLLFQLLHHLIGDHSTAEEMYVEIQAFLDGRGDALQSPQPFRNLVAQARLGLSQQAHERFFTDMLADVDESTLPFGLAEIYRDGSQVTESHRMLPQDLNNRLRAQAKRLGVSLASLCHLAWAQVLARASGQQRVVFGTVLFGRMQAGEGADRAMGLFINTLPLRIDLDNRSVQDSVRDTHARLAALLEHEHASLALAQRCSSVPAGTPLFSALLNYRHNAMPSDESQMMPGIELLRAEERDNYPFGLSVEDFGEALGLTAQIVQPFDPDRVCGYMQQALESLVKALEHAPQTPARQLEVLPDTERELLLQTWNATAAPYPARLCLHQLFEVQVECMPDATALVYENQVLSYAALNTCANRLAHQLIELGVAPDVRVAICVERSPALVVGLLAILKAGGAYVPLDPAYPSERLTYILTDAAPAILLADAAGRASLGEAALASLTVLDPNRVPEAPIINPHIPDLAPHHLAYVIYTSGSTGMPKGVMVEHRGIVNLAQAQTAHFGILPSSRVLQFASLSFDVSVGEIFMTLGCGAGLYLPPDSVRRDRNALWDYLARYTITHADLAPALLGNGEDLPSLSISLTLILGGEAPNAPLLQTLSHQGVIFNAYGPTETTVSATIWRYSHDLNSKVVPIGRPIANTRIYLLDAYGQPVPLGAVGELYIGGVGVARGYLNRPELTAERFRPDPFSDCEEARMYKTGDLARYLLDGNLELLGRNDHQVKIRGFRIEPGEIEARLVEHPQVREAALLALGEDSDKRLIAYVVAEPDEQLASTLRSYLTTRLPEYMMPAAFVRLDALPLTPNGKLDRRALPAPDGGAFARQAYEAPQGKIETALAVIWSGLLKVEQISRHDSFFALGGHSLLAVRLISLIRSTLGIEITIRMLFDVPTIAGLAQRLLKRDGTQDDSFDVLLPIKPTGTQPPLFCVHAVNGLSWHYMGLVSQLDADQPVYGLQARGLNGVPPLAETIDAMASDYIRQIRRIQPNGPYYLLGWSFGGKVVHAMATQLEQQGEKVALLALLDSYPDPAQQDDELETMQEAFYIKLLARYGDENMPDAGEYLWEKTRDALKNNIRLLKSFSPRIYCGDMLFFRATIDEDESIPLPSPDLWKPYVLGDIEAYDIHCTHDDMDQPAPMIEMGRILAQKLNELMRRQPPQNEEEFLT